MSTKPPHIPAPEIPELPAGTLLRLRSGDWYHIHDLPCTAYCDMTVAKVHAGVTREDLGHLWLWVTGHDHPTCSWESVEPHPPCIELMVRLDVLRRVAGQVDGTATT
ncbi:hypothetical protein [Plantactinospora sp. WMMB782]|uniref:hypothetical protein n=1 Tax=Plantactinospora sp. WMMB782 TaxID=3404121 RepID=UPI003B93C31A